MIKVKATREGLLGGVTSSGYVIDKHVRFVALPCTSALHKTVRVRNPVNGKVCYAQVLDVGPWNEHDFGYVFGGARPKAESELDERGRHTNRAGIDLSERVWHELEMKDNTVVEWEFV